MRTIELYPKATDESERFLYNDLVRGVANVLVWAADSKMQKVVYEFHREPPFVFVDSQGTETTTCKNVADPPEELRAAISRSLLRALAGFNEAVFACSLLTAKLWPKERHALLKIATAEGDLYWHMNYTPRRTVFCFVEKIDANE